MQDQDSEYFSKEGLDKLKTELESLKKKKRKEIADRLEFAKSLGDLSENAEYSEAKEAQMLNESKIAEFEDILRRAVVVKQTAQKETVDIGSQIVIEDEKGPRLTLTIVGSQEANPKDQKISNESPLGHALLGHKKGETVKSFTPAGEKTYRILDII
ncbi:transcription elongation factor GreA [Candidatus Giovannonibacteria bacterium RIFCSPHIGHO2_01_FULL_45_33]|uniref:Transcription elongation factor GreA n=1 Tax=Candidatus Giovannonibacteria bacterium RIFCSPLOWO2_01_FULL_45_34 TaxID=1798351 RepID=A0A1F5WZD1_9BACT|nr:MAG: transcription elongation factor GreA [Candidatus Giovannonibacteria bacterium RIFCSPHIGHO2_01_FULL_45_33]OGF69228.1 MAG: transcription elongation factor GreA [Candidatus Giovannonibacteria bacterium RIFCSPHIGHO2_02_FULL_44_11]OGF81015.1 MAG: transcription elongation factor GreA [Candidatus Giovannonibacteria bacterium RIFCSPLOWO2_01_FULL_45_34]